MTYTDTATSTLTTTSTVTATNTATDTPTSLPGFSAKAYPNVTNGQTPIQFQVNLPSAMRIEWVLYDVAGELIDVTSLQGSAGTNLFSWTPHNQQGKGLVSGLYIYYIRAGDNKKIGKIFIRH
jgi:hypothetical protein